MSLKVYTIINTFIFILILLFFTIISSVAICFVQLDFSFLFLYFLRNIGHLFEIYNIVVLILYFIVFILITYYNEKVRKLLFIIFSSLILITIVNIHDLKSLFIYRSQPVDKYFYAYLGAYIFTFLLWNILLKRIWKISFVENKKK